jgi:hypothetical protein
MLGIGPLKLLVPKNIYVEIFLYTCLIAESYFKNIITTQERN